MKTLLFILFLNKMNVSELIIFRNELTNNKDYPTTQSHILLNEIRNVLSDKLEYQFFSEIN